MRTNIKLFCTALFLAGSIFSWAQQKTISGQVTDSDGFPVADAYVYVEGADSGVYTDADGNYSLTANQGDKVLIEFIGFGTKTITVGAKSKYNVEISEEGVALVDIVQVGYRKLTRGEETGSISIIDGKDINDRPVTSFEEALKGSASGVQITNPSGQPGSYTSINIRGIGSLNGNNEPLYIVDGVFMDGQSPSFLNGPGASLVSPLSSINPNDIKEVIVLKDAASTSIYGSRGANGVIIVNTKKGNKGNAKVSYNSSYGVANILDIHYRPLNASEYTLIRRESLVNQGLDPAQAVLNVPDPTVDTNWADYAFVDNAVTMAHNLSIAGGGEKTSYYASLGYLDQDGVILGSGFERMNAKLNLDMRVSDRFNVGISTALSRENQGTPGTNRAFFTNPFVAYFLSSPVVAPYLENGEPNKNIGLGDTSFLAVNKYNKEDLVKNRVIASLNATYKLLDNLSYTMRGNVDYLDNRYSEYYDERTGGNSAAENGGYLLKTGSYYQTWSLTNTLQWDKKIGNNNLSLMLGQEALAFINEDFSARAVGFVSPDVVSLSTASEPNETGQYFGDYTIQSFFGNLNYDYAGKYFLNATLRKDGSSRFSLDNRWGTFWSAGLTWKLEKESFIQDIDWINELQPRFSYGTQGNLPSGYYAHLGLYDYTAGYQGGNGAIESQIANPNLKWEEQALLDVGIDFKLFDRFYGSYSYFNRKTSDLIIERPLSYTTGFSKQFQNYGAMTNKGHEITLGVDVFNGEDFSWNVEGNVTFMNNEMSNTDEPYFETTWIYRQNGVSIYDFYLKEWAGVDPANGDALWYDKDGNLTNQWSKAAYKFLGSAMPDYYGGVKTKLSYKGIELSASGNFKYGNKIYDNMSRYTLADGFRSFNQSSRILTRWQNPGDITNVPRLGVAQNSDAQNHSSRYLRDGSYFRVQNVTLGYNFPKDLIGQAGLGGLRIYVQGQNVYTFTNFDYDPEIALTGPESSKGGHFFAFPNATTYTVGIQVTF